MKIAEKDARDLFVGLGFSPKAAAGWTKDVLLVKVNKLPDSLDDTSKVASLPKKLKALFNQISEAKEDGAKITFGDGPAAKGGKPAPAVKGKKGKAAEPEEDDEEEDIDDETEEDEEEEEDDDEEEEEEEDVKPAPKKGKGKKAAEPEDDDEDEEDADGDESDDDEGDEDESDDSEEEEEEDDTEDSDEDDDLDDEDEDEEDADEEDDDEEDDEVETATKTGKKTGVKAAAGKNGKPGKKTTTKAGDKPAKKKTGAGKGGGGFKKEGKIDKIIDLLLAATAAKPLSKAKLIEKMQAAFPDSADGVKTTVNNQLGYHLKHKGWAISSSEKGKWLDPAKNKTMIKARTAAG